ncbi:hypothetical protein BN961_00920 [Afipia felis]|uniref:Uncharacterized protein n=1 Tax=Afipia felis TaxID=1035 RepID=A0A090N6V8_AFIFE|nr:hypothetical protein BN961_00920 [Afipia felis]
MVVVLDGIGRIPGRNGTETREKMSRLSKQKGSAICRAFAVNSLCRRCYFCCAGVASLLFSWFC